ncbi:hypothetical protein [Larkinella sp. C7]|uniref:hypothetical protein n=1 Tax=Larkinella sp. C7 TaxID=2576607 RepID=UPI0014867CB9|nr:hypothetical protein [Larkinella sp. C7]
MSQVANTRIASVKIDTLELDLIQKKAQEIDKHIEAIKRLVCEINESNVNLVVSNL